MSQRNKKVIYMVQLQSERAKQKAMKAVSGLPGVDSISMDMTTRRITVIGKFDPIDVFKKLRKLCSVDIVSVGPAEEPGKKEEPKKDDMAKLEKEEPGKKEEPKKDDVAKLEKEEPGKKEEPKKDDVGKLEKEEPGKKEEPKKDDVAKLEKDDVVPFVYHPYIAYNPFMNQDDNVGSSDKKLNACVIC